jgi:hypothetical protein
MGEGGESVISGRWSVALWILNAKRLRLMHV